MAYIYRPHPKDGEGTVFTGVCLSTPGWGGGTPVPVLSQVLFRGYPSVRSFPGGVPQSWPGNTLVWGTPLSQDWGTPTPRTEQESKHLLHCGRYASCVHAGLSCLIFFRRSGPTHSPYKRVVATVPFNK